jgi:ABC-type bacteriocin/lantibiotic exporter with double-glycine peptidase domain
MKKIQKSHTLQHDQTDCGVACLKSILRFYGSDASLEKLRELSGTNTQGTTLLGLQQAAHEKGLEAEAFEVDNLEEFKTDADFPCIFHVLMDGRLQHYVVCYKADDSGYLIGDPAKGVELWTEQQLLEVWQSRIMLNLKVTPKLELQKAERKRRINWFLNLVKEDVPLLGSSAAMGIVIAALGLTTAYFTQKLIDDFLPNQQTTKILAGLALLLVLLLVRSGINYVRTVLLLRQSRDFNNRTAGRFYDTLLYLPKPFFDNRKTGDLITRMNDTRRIQGTILMLTNTAMIDLLVIVVSLGFVFSYSWILGLIGLLSVPLYSLLVMLFTRPIISGQKEVMGAYGLTESNYIDTITGVGIIKAYSKESVFSALTRNTYAIFQDRAFSLGMLGNRYGTLAEIFSTLLLLSILGVSSYMVVDGKIKTGEMMAVVTIAGGVIASIARLANTNIQVQEAVVAFERMFEFTDTKSEDYTIKGYNLPDKIETITLEGISFRFAGRKSLLENVNLTLNRGEFTVLKGEVGSGKSVLLNIIQRFYFPESGNITINNNQDVSSFSLTDWRGRIGLVEQDVKIFNGLLLDNITLGDPVQNPELFIELLRNLGLESFLSELPAGLSTVIGESGVKLSGGQKQLVALARALYKNPEILLLDEPTAALDDNTANYILSVLNKIKQDKIILMITHLKTTIGDKEYYLGDKKIKVLD